MSGIQGTGIKTLNEPSQPLYFNEIIRDAIIDRCDMEWRFKPVG